jgi:hypothetical protein
MCDVGFRENERGIFVARQVVRRAAAAVAIAAAVSLAATALPAPAQASTGALATTALTTTAITVTGSTNTVAAYGAEPVTFATTAQAGPISGPADAVYTTTDALAVVSGSAITFHTPGVQTVTASSGGLTAVTTVTVTALPAAALTVDVGSATTVHRTGTRLAVTVSGLTPGEPYTISVGGTVAGAGLVPTSGVARQSVTVPRTLTDGIRLVTVTGSVPTRVGSGSISVLQTYKTLRISSTPHTVVLVRQKVRITVRGLLGRERVTVRYRGHRISPAGAVANAQGVYRVTTKAGPTKGLKPVTARGSLAHRRGDSFVFVQHRR